MQNIKYSNRYESHFCHGLRVPQVRGLTDFTVADDNDTRREL